MSALERIGRRIWICNGPRVKMMGIPFCTRMTVVALEGDLLWVHSPVPPSADLLDEVAQLGQVRFIVAPNKIHSRGLQPWCEAFREAEAWVSPRFPERHADLSFSGVIEADKPAPWSNEIDAVLFEGSRYLDEVVFFHRLSHTLIFTDLIQRHDPRCEAFPWQVLKRAAGVLGPLGGTSIDLRMTFTDRAAARASAHAILDWDFDRVVISHGLLIQGNARATVQRALAWALS